MRALMALAAGLCWGQTHPSHRSLNAALREAFDRAAGGRLVRDSDGVYAMLETGGGRLTLRTSADDFAAARALAASADVLSAGMALDGAGRLYVCWTTRAGSTRCGEAGLRDSGPLKASAALAETGSRLGDVAAAPGGAVWAAWTVQDGAHKTRVRLARVGSPAFTAAEGDGFAPPSLAFDAAGRAHLAWHDIYQDAWRLSGGVEDLRARKSEPSMVRHEAFRPVVAGAEGELAVYESTTSSIGALLPGKSGASVRVAGGDARFNWGISHSPQFAIDRYGVPWLFYIDSTRQRVFRSRWLGAQWSDPHSGPWLTRNSPRFEDNHLAIDRIAAEARAPGAEIGLALWNESEAPRRAFHRIPVPSLEAKPGTKVLFFDLDEIQRMEGLRLKVHQAVRHPANPVIRRGGPEDFDSLRAGNFLRVLKEGGRYRMWYVGLHPSKAPVRWPDLYRAGHAESGDGLGFRKTGPLPGLPYVPSVMPDPRDPDPRRRYKLLHFPITTFVSDQGRDGRQNLWEEATRGKLLTSVDGLRWNEEEARVDFPGGKPADLYPQSYFLDEGEPDPAKRYKAYGYTVLTGSRRAAAYLYSADAVRWTAHPQNPVLDPYARGDDVVRGGMQHQIHDVSVAPYAGYYVALYQYQHGHDHLDIELAASRDGENFTFIRPGEKVIARGAPGAWDCDNIFASAPFADGDRVRIYYGGMCGETGAGGLATLRLDGFTSLGPAPGRQSGSLTTIPVRRGAASEIRLNADCGPGGRIEADLLDAATGRTIAESLPIAGDVLSEAVRWKGAVSLAERDFQLRLRLSGQETRIYAIEFR